MELHKLPEDNPDPGKWDFTAARLLLFYLSASPETDLSTLTVLDPEAYNAHNLTTQSPKGLGDFDRLFKYCRQPSIVSESSTDSSSPSPSNGEFSTPASSAPEDAAIHFDDFVHKRKHRVKWRDQEEAADLARLQRRTGCYTKGLGLADFESDSEEERSITSRRSSRVRTQSLLKLSPFPPALTPDEKRLPSPPFPDPILFERFADPSAIKPQYTLTLQEQKAKLIKKLVKRFPHEATLLKSQEILMYQGGIKHSSGIHVFVDLSNIVIGFNERIKHNRRQMGRLGHNTRVKQPPFSFHSLSLVLERGRAVACRVMAGSTSHLLYNSNGPVVPEHVCEGERLGYQPNILERVNKPQNQTSRRTKGGLGSGYATTGYSSASDSQTTRTTRMQEQAVDEILQMKMLESLIDYEKMPSTIVLASGDAAEAEYSGGFLKTVERALARGWKVEVVAWKDGMSMEYRSPALLRRWRNNLTIIELDDFAEEMLAVYIQKYGHL